MAKTPNANNGRLIRKTVEASGAATDLSGAAQSGSSKMTRVIRKNEENLFKKSLLKPKQPKSWSLTL
jgi:hypothetical protein